MVIAVASGKGGTGKTTLATNLALAWQVNQFLDCDVEAPNAHHFLKPQTQASIGVYTYVPILNPAFCSGCGACVDFCRYNALALVKKKVLLFPELCHGCGGCQLVCEAGAIRSGEQEIGRVEVGKVEGIGEFSTGSLKIGMPSGAPIIRKMKQRLEPGHAIIDCPPGAACLMIEAVAGADFCLLVAEPTPFGLHDLEIAAATLRDLGIPAGVVINKDGSGDDRVEQFCHEKHLPVLLRIPESQEIASSYAQGIPFIETIPAWRTKLRRLGDELQEVVGK